MSKISFGILDSYQVIGLEADNHKKNKCWNFFKVNPRKQSSLQAFVMFWIFSVFILYLVAIVECKYCWHKTGFGKSSHFYCSAFQYCCGNRCCENIDQFYKLWYFWLCVFILILSACIAFYWLRRRYIVSQIFLQDMPTERTQPRSRNRRSRRRYRQLSGDGVTMSPPAVIIPDSVVTSPPPYLGDNTGVPHPGPPPYCVTLGSGSSINSTTLPRFPPPYSQVEKLPPPCYSSRDEIIIIDNEEKCIKHCEDGNTGTS